jgi:hypothetical protein
MRGSGAPNFGSGPRRVSRNPVASPSAVGALGQIFAAAQMSNRFGNARSKNPDANSVRTQLSPEELMERISERNQQHEQQYYGREEEYYRKKFEEELRQEREYANDVKVEEGVGRMLDVAEQNKLRKQIAPELNKIFKNWPQLREHAGIVEALLKFYVQNNIQLSGMVDSANFRHTLPRVINMVRNKFYENRLDSKSRKNPAILTELVTESIQEINEEAQAMQQHGMMR